MCNKDTISDNEDYQKLERDIQNRVRNPLQAISILADALFAESKDKDAVKPYITRIKKQVQELTGYLNALPEKFRQCNQDQNEE